MNVALSFIFNCPLIAYFLKKNYSLRQNIFEIFEGLREVSHISPNWYLFLILLELGLDWEQAARRTLKIC